MKKILLFVLALFSVQAFSQTVESVAEFDFSKPDSLVSNPPISIMSGSLDYLLNNKTLSANDGDVIMTFPSAGNGVVFGYEQGVSESELVYYLQIRTWGEMQIKLGKNGIELQKIEFTGFIGELSNVNSVEQTWFSSGQHVSSVTFKNGTTITAIRKIRVTYTKKPEPLKLLKPTNNSTFEGTSFKSIMLNFNQVVSVENADAGILYQINDRKRRLDEGSPMKMRLDEYNHNKVILSATGPIKNGRYEISIPEGVIKTSQGAVNDAITLYYTYDGKLEMPSISPLAAEDTTFFQLPQEIVLNFDQDVLVAPGYEYVSDGLRNPNGEYFTYNISQDELNSKRVKLFVDFDEVSPEILMEQGEWIYIVPEGAIRATSEEELPNPEISISYVVDNTSKLMEEVRVLDSKSRNGSSAAVGFPNLESSGRMELNKVLDGQKHSYAEIKDAIYAFSQEEDVMLPEDGKWYQIAGVSGDQSMYLRSHNGEMSLEKEVKNATAFKTVTVDGKYYLQTKEGGYLTIVEATENAGINIKTMKEPQAIALEKYLIENDTIIGLLSLNADEALFAEMMIGEAKSRGFMLFESDEQANLVKPEIKLSSYSIEKAGDRLLLTVENADNVYLMDDYAPYFKKDGVEVKTYSPVLTKVGQHSHDFLVRTEELKAAGDYELVIPDGIFKYEKEGYDYDEFDVSQLIIRFNISNGSVNEEDPNLPPFTFDYNNYSVLQYTTKNISHMQSVDLNDIVIYASMDEYTDLVADTTKKVRFVSYYGGTEIARGHFMPYPEFEETYGVERSKALILKLDEPFEKGSMKNYTGLYYMIVEAATIGDKNFGDYINDTIPKSEKPKPEECRVNPKFSSFTFYLDDSKADIETPSDEVWRKAYYLLKLEGVGYPKSTSPARKSLEAKVDSREGSDSQYETAINDFYNTAVVTMPEKLQFYRIKAVSDSTEVYLGYDGKQITFVNEADATGFVATLVSGNTFKLQLGDSRYAQQFSAPDNVTDEYSPINDFTLTKLTIEGVDAEKTFGKFSLKTKDGYAIVDVKNKAFMEEIATPSIFTKGETCAFVLEEVKDLKDLKAPDYIPVLDPNEEDEIKDFKRLNIIFDSYPEITLSDSKKIKLYGKSSKDLAEITVTPNENQRNAFIVDIAKLPQSTRYTLSIEQGAFTFSFAREPREIGGFIAIYDNVTGITSIYVDVTDEPLYDLQGRKVSGNLKAGIYIKNGKKVYIK